MERILQVGAVIAVIALLVLGWWFIHTPSDGPKVTEAKKLLVTATDGRQASVIRDQAGPQEIQCDRTTRSLRFFDSNSAEPKVWYSTDVFTGHISCWDRDGFDPYTGEALRPVIDKGTGSNGVRGQIVAQEPSEKYRPRAVVVRQQAPPTTLPASPRMEIRATQPTAGQTTENCSPDGCGSGWGPVTRQIDSWPQGQ